MCVHCNWVKFVGSYVAGKHFYHTHITDFLILLKYVEVCVDVGIGISLLLPVWQYKISTKCMTTISGFSAENFVGVCGRWNWVKFIAMYVAGQH